MAYPKIKMERPNPYNGLDWIVAADESLFANEGLDVELVPHGGEKKTNIDITDWNQIPSNAGHAEAMERGCANIFNACEWGNYRRSQDTQVGCRQVGRRASVVCGGIAVPPWSDVYTPQQLANKTIAVPFHAGTHYLTLQLLEGFLPRDLIRVVSSGRPSERYRAMMSRTVDACSVREPWITVAEKNGCRIILQGFYNGTDTASPEIDAETYAAINRALSEAVRRINADKRAYLHYFIDSEKAPEVKALSIDDFNLNRIVFIEPGKPIPQEQLVRTYNWMVSANLIDRGHSIEDLVNTKVMTPA
ncbi:MAG: ABC transporter substrate-binding protein [Deltaproteobacteria bacterium]|nr:ABC transporter substrate-binding protein [Deltaproteobacteria bacterium]